MNVTRDVLTDLLPVYFSGEASEDTKRMMEEYFRENPDFERIARKTATALEDLRMTAPVAPEAEREKYDLQWAREELFRRRVSFGVALLFTLAPLMTLYRDGRVVWTAILTDPWLLALCWSLGALCWFQYFARPSRLTIAMVWSVYFALLPLMQAFHLFLPGWQIGLSHRLAFATVMWANACLIWASYLRQSRKHRAGVP